MNGVKFVGFLIFMGILVGSTARPQRVRRQYSYSYYPYYHYPARAAGYRVLPWSTTSGRPGYDAVVGSPGARVHLLCSDCF